MKHRKVITAWAMTVLIGVAPAFAVDQDSAHPLVKAGSQAVAVELKADAGGSAWNYDSTKSSSSRNAYTAGNSYTKEAGNSTMSLTVTDIGMLSFDWNISTSNGSGYGLFYNWDTPPTAESKAWVQSGNWNEWNTRTIDVSPTVLGSDGTATLYISYLRPGTESSSGSQDFVSIANVYQSSERNTVTLSTDGAEYGSITGEWDGSPLNPSGANVISKNAEITLTATETGSGRFYGWYKDGKFLDSNKTYTTTVENDFGVKAYFAAKDSFTVRKNGEFLTSSLQEVLQSAVSGDEIEMLKDANLNDAAIPEGVTLYVPYQTGFKRTEDGKITAHTCGGADTINAASIKPYVTLTVDGTLTVNGTLLTGGFNSSPSHNYQGHTSGAYGAIVNNGIINVNGTLDLWGYVNGSGEVNANNGGKVYEPFIVTDFSGGSASGGLFFEGQVPFKRYAMQNVKCTLRVNSGGSLMAHCSLYASSAYHETDAPVVAPGKALFCTKDGTTAVRTINDADALIGTTGNGTSGISRATWDFTGGMNFQSLSLTVLDMDMDTGDMDFPIPYNFKFNLNNGIYGIPGRLKLMPGAEMHVGADAELDVTGWFYVFDGLKQSYIGNNKTYPTSEELKNGGFSTAATLKVDGLLKVYGGTVNNTPACFGGIVQSGTNTARIELDPNVTLSREVQDGALAEFMTAKYNNTSKLTLAARANVDGSLAPLKAGKTYYSWGNNDFILPSYTISWVPGYKQAIITDEVVTVNQPMTGKWSLSVPSDTGAEVNHVTYYSENDHERTHTASLTSNGDTLSLKVEKDDPNYVFQVSYKTGDEDTIVTAGEDGNYAIPVTAESITVMSVILGDVSLNGKIAMNDVFLIQKAIAETQNLTELQMLAADCNGNGSIAMIDALRLQKFYVGERTTVY